MGDLGNTLTAFIFFFLSVIIISNTAITIYNYNKNNQAKDVNYWWSVTCLVFAIIGLLISGFMFYKSGKANFQGGGNTPSSNGDAASALKTAESQARNIANAAAARAAAASNASKAVELAKAAGIKV